jgi:hypothetical protein
VPGRNRPCDNNELSKFEDVVEPAALATPSVALLVAVLVLIVVARAPPEPLGLIGKRRLLLPGPLLQELVELPAVQGSLMPGRPACERPGQSGRSKFFTPQVDVNGNIEATQSLAA